MPVPEMSPRSKLPATLAVALRSSPTPLFATDREGRWTYANKAWSLLAERPADQFLGAGWAEWLHPEDRSHVLEQWSEAVASRAPFTSFFRLQAARGPIWVTVEALPMHEEGTWIGHSGSARMVSDDVIEASNLATRGLAHDLNNMLTVLSGSLELEILRNPVGDDLSLSLRDALTRTTELTKEMLGEREARVRTDLNALVRSVMTLVVRILPETIVTRLDLDPSLGPTDTFTPSLWRSLVNLTLNAREAMPKGGTLTIETRRLNSGDDPRARITVRDTGAGIASKDLRHVLQPLVTTKKKDRPRGLGLAMVNTCAKRHGGRLIVESREGTGSTFHLELPLTR